MGAAALSIQRGAPGLFPDELRGAEDIASHVRLLMQREHQPQKDDGNAIVDYLQEMVSWSASLVEARTNCLLKREEAYATALREALTVPNISVTVARELAQAKCARYFAAYDHIERLEAHLARGVEAYRSILSALKSERERQGYSGT